MPDPLTPLFADLVDGAVTRSLLRLMNGVMGERRLDPLRRTVFGALLHVAQQTGPLREDAPADMGPAWPLMRRMLLGIGADLVGAGVVDRPEDVFWLREAELREAELREVLGDVAAGGADLGDASPNDACSGEGAGG